MKAGPNARRELPGMLLGLTENEIEVVEPLPVEFSEAAPYITHPSEAMQWINAHHGNSPIARHAISVLETVGALDLAFDTFVVTLLDGETDTSGYPEYNAIVGGVASHWDEATGDMIVRALAGWGGKGVRGDTDRTADAHPVGPADEHPGQPVRHRPDAARPARAGRRPRRPGLRPLRLRVRPRSRLLLPQVRHAPAARLDRPTTRALLRLRLPGVRSAHRGDARRPRHRPGALRRVRRPDAAPHLPSFHPLQGLRLGQDGRAREQCIGRPQPRVERRGRRRFEQRGRRRPPMARARTRRRAAARPRPTAGTRRAPKPAKAGRRPRRVPAAGTRPDECRGPSPTGSP